MSTGRPASGQRIDRRPLGAAGLAILALAAVLLAACDTRSEPTRQVLSTAQPVSTDGQDRLAATQTSAREALATIQAANLTGTPCGTSESSGYIVIYDLFGSPTPTRTPTITSTPRPAR